MSKRPDELSDPIRLGQSARFNADGTVTITDGRYRCVHCDEIPVLLFGDPGHHICYQCQVALYKTAYAAFVASREQAYQPPPSLWKRDLGRRVEVLVNLAYGIVYGFWLATCWL